MVLPESALDPPRDGRETVKNASDTAGPGRANSVDHYRNGNCPAEVEIGPAPTVPDVI
jgi:hypothetical protein